MNLVTDQANIIRLAEWMGWKRGEVHTVAVMGRPISAQRWIDPQGNDRAPSSVPNPYIDANDCEALKKHLRDYGWHIEIRWQAHTNFCPAPAVYVEIWHEASEIHHLLDTDRGEPFTVASVALKVLDQEQSDE